MNCFNLTHELPVCMGGGVIRDSSGEKTHSVHVLEAIQPLCRKFHSHCRWFIILYLTNGFRF